MRVIFLFLILLAVTSCTINKHGVFIGSESQKEYTKLLKTLNTVEVSNVE